jgi:serine-type D-Ala-D-Ala carboxypeptidase (penicillin-binding protein 5/6)
MQLRHPREIERWLTHTVAWPLVLLISLVALLATIAHEASRGPTVVPAKQRLDSAAHAVVVSFGPAPSISAPAAFVYDADTSAVYYARHADDRRAMASCTKVMTALVAVQHGALNRLVTVGDDAAAHVNPDNSYMGLSAGETLTLSELLYGLLLPSGNDAAVAIADAVGGNEPQFVAMMNAEAQTLGLTHTRYANSHGLDADGQYTSARDLAVLAAVALRDSTIAAIAATERYDIPQTATHKAFTLFNYNSLLSSARSPYPGAVGLKPGNTGAAGWCEAFAARREGHLIVGVVLGSATWAQRNVDMHLLLDWGFIHVGVPPAG